MNPSTEHRCNQDAYRRLKDTIERKYQHAQYVAISEGRIIADSHRFDDLRIRLASLGKDPTQTLVVQAGVDYPENAMILNDWPLTRFTPAAPP
jgi:hypothetical protein